MLSKKTIPIAVLGVAAVVLLVSAFQFGIDNIGAGPTGHIDLPTAGACTAGPANTIRLCGNSGGFFMSNNGGVPQDVLETASVTLTNAQVLAMNATPIQIIAAQGAGTLQEVVSANIENLNTGTAYANGGVIGLFYTSTAAAASEATTTLAATFLTTPTVKTVGLVTGTGAALVGSTALNAGLYISNLTAPFITGTGTLYVQVTYRVRSGL